MLVALAEYFQTLVLEIHIPLKLQIVVDETRYTNIKSLEFRPELFTTNPEEGWIEVLGDRSQKWEKLYNNFSIT